MGTGGIHSMWNSLPMRIGLIWAWRKCSIVFTRPNGGMFKWSRLARTGMKVVSNENWFLRHARVPHKVLYSLLFTLITVIIVLLLPSQVTKRVPVLLVDRASGSFLKDEYVFYQYNETYPLTEYVSKYLV